PHRRERTGCSPPPRRSGQSLQPPQRCAGAKIAWSWRLLRIGKAQLGGSLDGSLLPFQNFKLEQRQRRFGSNNVDQVSAAGCKAGGFKVSSVARQRQQFLARALPLADRASPH